MSLALPSFLNPTSDEPDMARRQFTLNVLVAGLVLLGLLWLAVDLLSRLLTGVLAADWPARRLTYLHLGLGLLMSVAAYWLSRRGRLKTGISLLIVALLVLAAWLTWLRGIESSAVVLFFLVMAAAGSLTRGPGGLLVATAALLLYGVVGVAQWLGLQPIPLNAPLLPLVIGFGLLLYLTAALNWVGNWHLDNARREAEQQAAELRAVREEQALILTELRAQTEQQAHLLRAVEDLAAPVIVIHDQIIALPLVGYLDDHRAGLIRQALLQGIARHRAAIALIDLTGLPTIGPDMVRHLEAMTQAGRLLGAEVALVGIQAGAATEIIRAGGDLRTVVTLRDLQSGLDWALAKMGKRIVSNG